MTGMTWIEVPISLSTLYIVNCVCFPYFVKKLHHKKAFLSHSIGGSNGILETVFLSSDKFTWQLLVDSVGLPLHYSIPRLSFHSCQWLSVRSGSVIIIITSSICFQWWYFQVLHPVLSAWLGYLKDSDSIAKSRYPSMNNIPTATNMQGAGGKSGAFSRWTCPKLLP